MEETNVKTNAAASTTIMKPVSSINSVNLLDENQLNAAKAVILQVMRSKKSGITSIEDGLAVLLKAQDLGLPFSACVEHIHVINGKTGTDVHIIKSLLLRAGVMFELVDDYAPIYEYTDGFNVYSGDKLPADVVKCRSKKEADSKSENDSDIIFVYPVRFYKDFSGNTYKEYQLNAKAVVVATQQQAKQAMEQGKLPVYKIAAVPIDYVTSYHFVRYMKVNGHEEKLEHTSHFSYSDALQAGFLEKETYQKYLRIMVGHRAFTLGAREIAADALMGVSELTELKMVNHMDIEEADIVEIK